jgi:bifunctional non-homologous end joining protein LigD
VPPSIRDGFLDGLRAIEVPHSPLSSGRGPAGANWYAPKVVAEVEFLERTESGKLRHAVLRGIRPDREAREIVRE